LASTQRSAKEELIAQDIKRLRGMGYAQEIFRTMGGFSNFAISFTIISVLSGCLTLFYTGITTSGFAAGAIGWKNFQRGPWHLGRWSKPVGIIAVVWGIFISVLFMLPTTNPITWVTFNYTPVVVVGTLLILTIWWLVSVRHWFKGPQVQGSAIELTNIEESLGETVLIDMEGAAGGE